MEQLEQELINKTYDNEVLEALKVVMKAVAAGAEKPLTAVEFFSRVIKVTNDKHDPESLAIYCGFDPDDLIVPGKK